MFPSTALPTEYAAEMPLWRCISYGHERNPAASRYWWDNRNRRPTDQVVLQRTIAGGMTLRTGDGADHPVPVAHAALFRYGEDSAYGLTRDAQVTYEHEWVNLVGAGLAQHWEALVRQHGPVVAMPSAGPAHRAMLKVVSLADPRHRTDPVTMARAIHALVAHLFETLAADRRQTLPPVERAIECILEQPCAPWSLKELADEHGVSREHLTREFHRRTGAAPAAWMTRQRTTRALELLATTTMSAKNIARLSGFSSVATLARQVRRSTGAGPAATRLGQHPGGTP